MPAELTPAEALKHAEFAVASYCKLTGHDEAVIVAVLRASVEDAATLSRIDPDALAKRIVRGLLVTGDGAFAGKDHFERKAAELIRQHIDAARAPAPGERT